MTRSPLFRRIIEILLESVIIFSCFFSLYFPLKDFIAYKNVFDELKDDYIYTLNKDYSALFDESAEVALYHFDYSSDGGVVYLNKKGAELGINVLDQAPFIGFYHFEILNYENLLEDVKYDLSRKDIIKNKQFKTDLGSVILDVRYLVIDEQIEDKFNCEYKIYPPSSSFLISDDVSINDGVFSARGKTIQRNIYSSSSNISFIMFSVSFICFLTLLIVSTSYFSLKINKETISIYINKVFYKKKQSVVFDLFLKTALRILILSVISILINYLLFVKNDFLFLFIPLIVFVVSEFLFLYFYINYKVNKVIKYGVKYE